MEWEFTAEDVVKAQADYRVQDFRRDLAEEVRRNLGESAEMQFARTFDLIYDLCYALATGRSLDDFLSAFAYDPPACDFLRELQPLMAANIEMLGAILQRMIMDGVETGMPLDEALQAAALRHRRLVETVA